MLRLFALGVVLAWLAAAAIGIYAVVLRAFYPRLLPVGLFPSGVALLLTGVVGSL